MDNQIIPEADDLGTSVGLHAGFPNAATTGGQGALSLDQLLIHSPSSTYFFRVRGHHWRSEGIYDGNIAIVDRSITPVQGSTVVWCTDTGELRIVRWRQGMQQNIWGTITATIHQWHDIERRTLNEEIRRRR